MTRNSGVQFRLIVSGCALVLGLVATRPADAGLLYPSGNPHPNAYNGWSGTVPLINATNNVHYGDIEYAVFRDFGFAAAFPGEDNPNGRVTASLNTAANEFIYAFQVYNILSTDITQFSAGLADIGGLPLPLHHGDGLDDAELVNSGDQDYIAGTGQAPNLSSVSSSALHGASSGSSVRFNFAGAMPDRLNSGEWSAVLFYTSPYGPRWDNGTTTTGSGQSRIPGPEVGVPEPSSLVLASLVLLGFAAWRRRERAI
jgi:hypothetical protein